MAFSPLLLLCKHGAKYWSDIDSLCTLLFHCFMEGFTVRKVRNGNLQKELVYRKHEDTRKPALSSVEMCKVKATTFQVI